MATDEPTGAHGAAEARPAYGSPAHLRAARAHVNSVLHRARARQRAAVAAPTPQDTLVYLRDYLAALPPRRRERLERDLILLALAGHLGRARRE
ncbi:MAG TPA: hypothetical protein VFL91_29455 [Thermomicrobiales bacterium]|nr:hypothetical protein [Thermomicrobiales bacterium]